MEEDIKKLLEENLAIAKETQEMVAGIRKYVRWQRVWGWVKFLIIVVPLVISLLYLPAFLNNLFGQYQELLGDSSNAKTISSLLGGSSSINLEKISPELMKNLK